MSKNIALRVLILFFGLSSLAIAEKGTGYLVSDTPIKVDYIICPAYRPQDCHKAKTPAEPTVTLNAAQKIYAVKNIPESGFAMIIGLTTDDKRSYTFIDSSTSLPCLLFNNGAVKFELYGDIILCQSQPAAVAAPR